MSLTNSPPSSTDSLSHATTSPTLPSSPPQPPLFTQSDDDIILRTSLKRSNWSHIEEESEHGIQGEHDSERKVTFVDETTLRDQSPVNGSPKNVHLIFTEGCDDGEEAFDLLETTTTTTIVPQPPPPPPLDRLHSSTLTTTMSTSPITMIHANNAQDRQACAETGNIDEHQLGIDLQTFTDDTMHTNDASPKEISTLSRPERLSYLAPVRTKPKKKTKKSKPKVNTNIARLLSRSVSYQPPPSWKRNPSLPIPRDAWDALEFGAQRSIDTLNTDELWCVIQFLSSNDFLALSLTCRHIQEITSNNIFWQRPRFFVTQRNGALSTYLQRMMESYKKRPHPLTTSWTTSLTSDPDFLPLLPTDFKYSTHKHLITDFKKKQKLSTTLPRMTTEVSRSNYAASNASFRVRGLLVLAHFILVCIWLGSILVPLNLDAYIPRSGYWWLFSFVPSTLFVIPLIFIIVYDAKRVKYFPWISRNIFVHQTSPDFFQCIFSLFLWVLYVMLAIGLKLLFFKDYSVWTYFMIPAVLLMLFNYVTVAIAVFVNLAESSYMASMLAIALSMFACFASFAVGLILSAARLDSFGWALRAPFSVYFIGFHIGILLLVHTFALFFYRIFCFDRGAAALWGLTLTFPLAGIISFPLFLTVLLCGLKADGVIGAPYIVTFIPLYTEMTVGLCCATTVAMCACALFLRKNSRRILL